MMRVLQNNLLTVRNVVRLTVLAALFVSSSSLNSRNYDDYKKSKNIKRETTLRSNNGGSTRVPQQATLRKDWDFADVLQYFRNERLVILQMRCFFNDGPCDLVGRKPSRCPQLGMKMPNCGQRLPNCGRHRILSHQVEFKGAPTNSWAETRVIPGFFGICKMCTATQNGWFDLWLSFLFEKFPDLIRAAMTRYLLSLGIKVPADEVQTMYNVFRRRRYGAFKIERINA